VLEFISNHCVNLIKLSLKALPEPTPDSIALLFKTLQMDRIEAINLKRLVQTKDLSLKYIVEKAHTTIKKLNINGLEELTSEYFKGPDCVKFDLLEDLDVSFVRSFCDDSLESVLKSPMLKKVKVYGVHRYAVFDNLTVG